MEIKVTRVRPFGYELQPSDAWASAHPDTLWTGILVQDDWSYPGVASTFGWFVGTVPAPDSYPYPVAIGAFRSCPNEHDETDGTIACPTCKAPASAFIESAAAWLDDHDGATADDPGYFGDGS